MAALPAGALPGIGTQPTGTDAQSGGLQSQTAGGPFGTARNVEKAPQMKTNARMKIRNHDENEANQSLFARAGHRSAHPFSKTTPFADISKGIESFSPALRGTNYAG